jgi:hypothetical protein
LAGASADRATFLASDQAFSMRNRIINGGMVIDQRNAGASVTGNNGVYFTDRWRAGASLNSKFTGQRSTTAPAGFSNSLLITSSSSYSVPSGETFTLAQFVEGFNAADLGWGAAGAASVTLSFWARSSLTGTFGGALANNATDRSYPFTYTVSAANTWEYKTVTVAGDTSGTWLTDNSIGIRVWFGLGVGSAVSGTAGSWAGADYRSATGATSVVGTNGATFYITGVDLRVGSYTVVPQDFRAYGTELALCQRYYQFIGGTNSAFPLWGGYQAANDEIYAPISFPVQMRAAPTTTKAGTWNTGGLATQPDAIYINTQGFSIRVQKSASSGTFYVHPNSSDDIITFSAEL